MSQADEIRHSSYTKAGRHSAIWHDGVGANSRLEISEAPARPFANGEFLLREIAVHPKVHSGGKATILFFSDLHWDGWNRKIYVALADAIRGLNIDSILSAATSASIPIQLTAQSTGLQRFPRMAESSRSLATGNPA